VLGKVGNKKDSGTGRIALQSSNYPLFDNFFTRLTVAEITKLFRSYRIMLGENDTHRDLIINSIQTCSRTALENIIRHVLDKSKINSYEMVTVYSSTNNDGVIEFERIFFSRMLGV
jgi:hypothetical protein